MKLDVVRTQFGEDATNGMLFVDGVFECFTLEDEIRDVKVKGETAIPYGEYKVEFRTVGGFDTKYQARYGKTWHKGMLWVKDVPGFQFILIHTGNTDQHTAGCLLLGETQQDLDKGKDGFVGGSGDAYKKFYPKCRDALLAGEEVTIKYSKINLAGNQLSNASPPEMINSKDVFEKISEVNGEIKILNSKLEGKNII